MDLATATKVIYAADLADFMSTRKQSAAEARSAGDRELAKRLTGLRKPTLSAWALNRLVRERPDLVERLTDLGVRMRAAQSGLDAAALTGLRPERDAVFAAVIEGVGQLDAKVSGAALEEIRGSLVAALADASAEQAVTSGHLTRAVSYAGFGEVDLDEALAVPAAEVASSAQPVGVTPSSERGTVERDESDSEPATTPDSVDDSGPRATPARVASKPADGEQRPQRASEDQADHRRRRELKSAEQEAVEADREISAARLALADADNAASSAHRRARELAQLATAASHEAGIADDAAREARSRVSEAEKQARAAATRLRQARQVS